jgi:hypothetical protein
MDANGIEACMAIRKAIDRTPHRLADDLLRGADEIAEYVFGDAQERTRIYQLTHALPFFRMGSIICARKSTLLAWIDEQERHGKVAAV